MSAEPDRRRRSASRLPPLLLAWLVAGLAACGDARERPTWIRLALDLPLGGVERTGAPALAAGRVSLAEDELGAWIRLELTRADWRDRPDFGAWFAPLTAFGVGRPPAGAAAQRLTSGALAFTYSPPSLLKRQWKLPEGGFYASERGVLLRLAPGQEPPARATLAVYAARPERADGALRATGERHSGDGFALWSGEAVTARLDLPAESALRFVAAFEPALFLPAGTLADGALAFRVTLDGELLVEERFADAHTAASRRVVVPLPPAGRADATLRFEVSGALAHSAFLAPVVGPLEVGRPDDRPWGATRPDVVVFLADTFRADNLGVYGGRDELTPNLDRFAREGVLFERAWSVGTYTLPAHVSMFSGLFPLQAGIVGKKQALPAAVPTLAEELARHGYRTGAVTDSVIVSSGYGLDQGFEWFDELHDDLEGSLARAQSFLDADDGRPVFLFLQTYRTHTPYHVSAETRAAYGARLGIEGEFAALDAEWNRVKQTANLLDPAVQQRRRYLLDKLRALYLGGVVDLDRGFERFRADLERRGMLARGHLLFTSDHGEAFFEHDAVFHPGKVWEELARVPLLAGGGGLGPEVIGAPASLVDLAPTVAALAGVAPRGEWLGRALFQQREARPVYVFQCVESDDATVAVIEGDHKVLALEDAEKLEAAEVWRAFDLAADPRELHDRAREPWAREQLERLGGHASALLVPVVDPSAATLDPARLEALRELGYAGED